MKQLYTEIEINASAQKVWSVLTNFGDYPEWNPFIRYFEGQPEEGQQFKVTIQQPDSNAMTFQPVCLAYKENKEFRWSGHLLFKGLFDGEHIFKLEDLGNGKTKFIHKEKFKGILVPVLWKQLDTTTRKGFQLMNDELKYLAENLN
ncbi:MAG TPA: SRPBCC domain-containing protein [Bacteroidetes bacterium]|nr:SRPBCC domain-containing protein [Bacteroidota bacterium]